MNTNGELYITARISERNEDGDYVETTTEVSLGKCIVTPNEQAQQVRGSDGTVYLYSYAIFIKASRERPIIKGAIRVNKLSIDGTPIDIPIEGASVRLVKSDGSIDKLCKVRGFVTIRNWIKLWV